MDDFHVYKDIEARTGGEIYIGVVGPVRTGKSTFIKRFMELLVLPKLPDGQKKAQTRDELPQSAAGKTIMTTEPKFIPKEAAELDLAEGIRAKVRLIEAEDYLAAPVVGEVGAGPGYLPQDEVQSWFLVYKHVPAIMGRRNLIAVEIGKTSTSMLPLLSPGDIVLVDRDDIDVSHAGHIMLVRDPEGAGMVKRVSVQPTPGSRDFSIQFYSDNAATNPPLLYSLREDYGGEISNAIVGRVIWAWSDVRGK